MNIEDQKVVDFHYTLTNEQGETVESSRERDPMSYLHGANNIIPGLEQAMNGRAAGDTFEVTVQPADAYGERQEDLNRQVSEFFFAWTATAGVTFHRGDAGIGLEWRRLYSEEFGSAGLNVPNDSDSHQIALTFSRLF